MKAISLWEPWASLWASGQKINETRIKGRQGFFHVPDNILNFSTTAGEKE